MKKICLGLFALVIFLVGWNRLAWFLSLSVNLDPAGETQTCFGEYIAVIGKDSSVRVFDRELNLLITPNIANNPGESASNGKLYLTALTPECLDLPGLQCTRKSIAAAQTECTNAIFDLHVFTSRDETQLKLSPTVSASVIVKSLSDSRLANVILQGGGKMQSFQIMRDQDEPTYFVNESGTKQPFSTIGLQFNSYRYMRGSLDLYGQVIIPMDVEKHHVRSAYNGQGSVLTTGLLKTPLCLSGTTALEVKISMRSTDDKTFSITREATSLAGGIQDFEDGIANESTISASRNLVNSQSQIHVTHSQDLIWKGKVKGADVEFRQVDCSEHQNSKHERRRMDTQPTVAGLVCYEVKDVGVALAVSEKFLFTTSTQGFRLIPHSTGLKTTPCPKDAFYPYDWERILRGHGVIQHKCVQIGGAKCRVTESFELKCETETLPLFARLLQDGRSGIQFRVSNAHIFDVDESSLVAVTKVASC